MWRGKTGTVGKGPPISQLGLSDQDKSDNPLSKRNRVLDCYRVEQYVRAHQAGTSVGVGACANLKCRMH